MANAQIKLRHRTARPKTRDAAAPTREEFRARLKAPANVGEIPGDTLDPDIFDNWEDAADLAKHYKSVPVEPLGHRDIAGSRRRARVRRRTSVRSNGPKPHKKPTTPRTTYHGIKGTPFGNGDARSPPGPATSAHLPVPSALRAQQKPGNEGFAFYAEAKPFLTEVSAGKIAR